jgi:hypothetical protein
MATRMPMMRSISTFSSKPPAALKVTKFKSPKALKSGGLKLNFSKLLSPAKKKAAIKSKLKHFTN